MGSDLTVVNAARVSFSKTSEWGTMPFAEGPVEGLLSEGDERLIKYLAKHNHWSPFGHASMQFHVKAPIFVARQLVKHQVGLVWNEVSRRYVDSEVEFYVKLLYVTSTSVEQFYTSESISKTIIDSTKTAYSTSFTNTETYLPTVGTKKLRVELWARRRNADGINPSVYFYFGQESLVLLWPKKDMLML